MRDKIIPVLWLLGAAVLVGVCLGVAARAGAQPLDPCLIVDPPQFRTSCVLLTPSQWLCPDGVSAPW